MQFLTKKDDLSNFFQIPVIDGVMIDYNKIYGYCECYWYDVPEFSEGFKYALQSKNHIWKCHVGTFEELDKIYLKSSDKHERLSNKIPDNQYQEEECFRGWAFFELDGNNIPFQIFTKANLQGTNNHKYFKKQFYSSNPNAIVGKRDLSIVVGNCPPFIWKL